jgi:polar amino acid transport system substrate-binding protein
MQEVVMWRKIIGLLIMFALVSLPAVGAQIRQDLVSQSTLAGIIDQNQIRVGFATFVPWAMKDKTGGYTGFEIEVATRLAEDMGVDIVFVPTKWSGIIPALLTGKFDIIIGGMGITPERNNADTTVVARIGTTAASAAKKYLPNAQLNLFDDEGQALQEVLNNRAAAMVSSQPFPEFQALKYPDKLFLPLEGKTFTQEPIGFAIRKGDVDFLNFLNNWIRVRTADGWLQERFAYWFTTREWQDRIE